MNLRSMLLATTAATACLLLPSDASAQAVVDRQIFSHDVCGVGGHGDYYYFCIDSDYEIDRVTAPSGNYVVTVTQNYTLSGYADADHTVVLASRDGTRTRHIVFAADEPRLYKIHDMYTEWADASGECRALVYKFVWLEANGEIVIQDESTEVIPCP